MKNSVIIADSTFENEYAIYKDILSNKIKILSEEIDTDIIYIDGNLRKDAPLDYMLDMHKLTEGYEDIIYITTYMPLIDINETKKMYNMHKESYAMYTYGENYPLGVVPSVIKRGALERLIKLLEDKKLPMSKNVIHESVFLEPNFFEIEILISEYDMRYYRLSFFSDSKANNVLISRLKECLDYGEMVSKIKNDMSLMRTLPSYIEIEITGKNNVQKRIFENRKEENKSMSLSDFSKIYDGIMEYSGSVHISIGGMNEPFLNENIFDILSKSVSNKNAKIYLETNASLLSKDNAHKLIALQNENDNLSVIIHIDAVDENIYSKIYKTEGMKNTLSNIEYYLLRMPKNTYIQIIKQTHNFEHLPSFYKYFEKYKTSIILQKYFTYRNKVQNSKVGDLSPAVRVCCWHLLRDMYIDIDGNALICPYDIDKEIILSNVLEKSIEEAWEAGNEYYKKDIESGLSFCRNCDEWYLYNF